jgi:hypothetical protein
MTRSEALRQRIILHLRHEWQAMDGGHWESFDRLAKQLDEPIASVKREVRRMALAGVPEFHRLTDDEGMMHGSGYLLVFDWLRHEPGRAGDPAPREESDG